MPTPITAEDIFSTHAVRLGLKPVGEGRSFDDYVADHGTNDEARRCLGFAIEAAKIADHSECSTWLAQARQHIKNPFPPDRR